MATRAPCTATAELDGNHPYCRRTRPTMSAADIEERRMIIIAGYELVSAKQRDTWVAAFRDLVTRAREFDGCLHVAITADSVDPERINTIEVWRDAEALQQWRKQAKAPRLGKPRYMAVQRYDATGGGPLF
jgi:quinol monooxygenase YgiN